MAEPLRLVALTPVETLIEATGVAWAQIELADGGPIRIYPGHAPLLAETVDGPLRYADGSGEHSMHLLGGILHITEEGVTVLTAGWAQRGGGVGGEPEVPPEGAGVHEEADELRFERLAQALLGDEDGIASNVASWLARHRIPGF